MEKKIDPAVGGTAGPGNTIVPNDDDYALHLAELADRQRHGLLPGPWVSGRLVDYLDSAVGHYGPDGPCITSLRYLREVAA